MKYTEKMLNELSNIKICYQISFITKRHLVFWHLVWPYWSHSLGSWIEHFIVWSITHILTYYITLHHVTILFALFPYVATHILQSCHFCANCTNHRFPNFVNRGVSGVRGWENSHCGQPLPPEQYSFEYNHFNDSQNSSWITRKTLVPYVRKRFSNIHTLYFVIAAIGMFTGIVLSSLVMNLLLLRPGHFGIAEYVMKRFSPSIT